MSKLNNIDDAIRNSFEKFEVAFDATLWNNIDGKLDNSPVNELTSFDKKIQETVSGHEAVYNPAAWTAVESQLASYYSYTKWFLAAGFIGLISLGIYFLTNNENEKSTITENSTKVKMVENKTAGDLENKTSIENEKLNNNSNSSINTDNNSNEVSGNSIVNNEEIEKSEIEKVKTENPNTINSNNNSVNQNNPIISNHISDLKISEKKWSISNPIISGKTEMCEGTEVKLVSSSVSEKVNIQWMLNGVLVSNNEEIILKNLTAGNHELELIHTAKAEFKNQCLNPELKKSVEIIVKENASVDFKFEQVGEAFYPETSFQVLAPEKNIKYTWSIDNFTFEGNEIAHLFNNKGNYLVQLLAENENGCSSTEIKNVEISIDYNLLAPNSFSPNFDGINDAFIPEALKYLNLPFKMIIYSRQNNIVFQTNRVDLHWDGRNMNNGETCGQGAYLWIVELTNKEGELEKYSGTITLLK
jgi:gliding motility-associated-like protein